MSIKVYLGTTSDLIARFAGPVSTTTANVLEATTTSLTLDAIVSFAVGDGITVNRYRRTITAINGTTVTLDQALPEAPDAGAVVRHYDPDVTNYRDAQGNAIVLVDDLKTGGNTGSPVGQDLVLINTDGLLPIPVEGMRLTLFDDVDPEAVLFGGVVERVERSVFAKARDGSLVETYTLEARGYQAEADAVGIEESPVVNVNAGAYLDYLRRKYTTLDAGEIDTVNSPTVDYIRLANYRRFSEVGQELANLWPGSEFYVENGQAGGKVYFRQKTASVAPMTLTDTYREARGVKSVRITTDLTKTFNVIRYPFYRLQRREPDLFVQSTVADNAFLKTSVVLNGIPANVEESLLIQEDFADGALAEGFTEDDLNNASPFPGFSEADGYLVEGTINNVRGLHLTDTSAAGTVNLGDIGRVTDPGEAEPFTGAERQTLYVQELVINTLGDAVIGGIVDQTTRTATIQASATTTSLPLDDATYFAVGDRVEVSGQKTYVTGKESNTLTVSPALSGAPTAGTAISLHRLALSRIKFGVLFKASGDLKAIINGVETAFSPARTYTAGPTTYSLRLTCQCFETTVASGASATGVTLSDAANFATGDVVELYTQGSRSEPETRVITKSGSAITYAATNATPAVGYRVRTKPKLVLQIKGGAYGSVTGRTWTTLYTGANTFQTGLTADRFGVLVALHKSLVATIPYFELKDPVGITANVGPRTLFLATQEAQTSDPDVDAIVRKVGSHYQMDFFPDTKTLWSSGSTLELRYDEKFLFHLEELDTESMRLVASQRGHTLSGTESETELRRLGGRTMDTVELSASPVTLTDASSTARAILDAVKDAQVTVEIDTNSEAETIPTAGDTLRSSLPGVPDLEVKQVQLTEVPGAVTSSGRALWLIRLRAGTVDRLADVLLRRDIKAGNRLVLDDGQAEDSFTKIEKSSFAEALRTAESYVLSECSAPTTDLYDGANPTKLICLRLPVAPAPVSGSPMGPLLIFLAP